MKTSLFRTTVHQRSSSVSWLFLLILIQTKYTIVTAKITFQQIRNTSNKAHSARYLQTMAKQPRWLRTGRQTHSCSHNNYNSNLYHNYNKIVAPESHLQQLQWIRLKAWIRFENSLHINNKRDLLIRIRLLILISNINSSR